MILDIIARSFLFFSTEIFIIPFVVIGYIWKDKDVFLNVICLILISSIINATLKATFAIPLNPSLGIEGFAFPSGHMQSSVILYGWFIKNNRKYWLKTLNVILLIGIGFGLVHFGYHDYIDVFGGVFVGISLIMIFSKLSDIYGIRLLVSLISFGALLLIYLSITYRILEYVWKMYYALLGVVCSTYYFRNRYLIPNLPDKISATVLLFILLVISQLYPITTLLPLLNQIPWIFIGFSIPFSLHFRKICYRNLIYDRR